MTSSASRRSDFSAATLLFAGFLFLFLFTTAQNLMFEDSGEFAASTYSLGVGHPPGYPLYNLLGHAFQQLPVGNPGFRINLMSAFLGALVPAALFLAIRALGFPAAAAALGAAAFGLSLTFWEQSVIAEVYALNSLINALLILCFARMLNGARRAVPAFLFLLGLAATNHYTTLAAFVPVLVLALVWTERTRPRALLPRLAAGSTIAAAALLIYSTIPLRAAANPIFNWRDPHSLQAFLEHIKRTQFNEWENQLAFHFPTLMKYLSSFITKMPAEFFGVFLFVAMLGVALLFSERRRIAAAAIWLWAVQSLGILLYIRFHADDAGLSVVRVFFLGAYLVTGIFIAAGAEGLMRNLGGSRRPWAATAVAAALALCLIAPLMHGWKENNFSKDNRFLAFDRDMFRYLPRDAVYYLNGTHFTSPAIYLHSAYNLRPDVTLIDSSGNLIRSQIEKINGPFKWANLDMAMDRTIDAYYGRLPLVFSYPVSFEGVGWTLAQRGPFFAPSAKADCDLRGWNPDKYGFTPESVEYRDFETRTLIPILYARLAECDFLNGDNQRGLAYVSRANAALPTSSHVALYSGELLDRYGFVNEAADYYQKAIDKCDTYTDAYIQLGNQMIESNQLAAAETEFKRALALSPSLTQAKLALANIASLKGDTLGAAAIYQKLLKADPDSVVVMNNLANAYLKLRRFASASALFKKAFALEPDSLLTLLNYSSYMLDAGRYNEAKAALEKALRIRPSFAYAHYNLGLALLRGGDSAGAIDQFKTTVRLSPKMIGAWTNLIILLLDHGRIEEARGEVALMQRITDQKFIANVIALYLKVEIKAAETNPEDGAAWSNIINTFLRLQQFSKAHETLDTLNSVAKTPRLKELAKLLDEQIKDVEAHSVSKEPLR